MRNRESEALARLLESGSRPSGEGPDELRALTRVARALEQPLPRPGDAFRSELRAMLLEEARERQATPRILPRVRSRVDGVVERWRYSTRVAAASLAAALTFSGGGAVAVAAEHALPSDALYGVKLALDEARAAVRFDVVAKGRLHLDNAAERVDEAERSVARGDTDGAAVALNESADSARKGFAALITGYEARGDRDIVRDLETFADTQARRVRVLATTLEGPAAEAARSSLVVLERIEARLVAIGGCTACGGQEAPRSGRAFDFSEIPPADEPFQPCPCDDGETDAAAGTTRTGDEPRQDEPPAVAGPADEEPPPPPEEPADDDPVQGLPEPVGDVVNEILKPIVTKSAEKGLPTSPATPELPALPADLLP